MGGDRGSPVTMSELPSLESIEILISWPCQPLLLSLSSQALHPNWCQQIKFIPQLNMVASCSAIEKSSLVLTVLPSKAQEHPK